MINWSPSNFIQRKPVRNHVLNRQTSGESASIPQYDEGTESAEVATSDHVLRIRFGSAKREVTRIILRPLSAISLLM